MITVSYRTPAPRYRQIAQYAQDHDLTLNGAISTMIDDFLCRQLLIADEARVSVPRSQDST
jgi:hypothetical protein